MLWDDIDFLQFPRLSQVVLEVLVFVYLLTLRPVEAEFVRNGYLDDLRLLVLLVPHVWLDGPSFHISHVNSLFPFRNTHCVAYCLMPYARHPSNNKRLSHQSIRSDRQHMSTYRLVHL